MKKAMLCLCLCCGLLLAGCGEQQAEVTGEDLTISVAALSSEVSFFDYDAGGTAMQVIARVDESGEPKLSYNTCQSCAGSPFAYFEVLDGQLICRNCGNRFAYSSIGEKRSGGCMPIALEGYTVEDGTVTIPAETLFGMKDSFVNWKKGL